MTDTVPAAATGLPSFDRRSFLSTLIAAGVLSAGTDLPAAASAEHPDAELLELEALCAAASARRAAFDTQTDVVYEQSYRPPPYTDAMCWRPRDRFSIWMHPEQLDGVKVNGVERRVYDDDRALSSIRDTLSVWKSLSPIDRMCGPEEVARAEEVVAAVEAWRAEEARISEACGYTALTNASEGETATIMALVEKIRVLPAHTAEGICAKARAAGKVYPGAPVLMRLMYSLIADAAKLGAIAPTVSSKARAAA